MEKPEGKKSDNEEVDLTVIFSWFSRSVARFFNGILWSIASIRNVFFHNRLFFAGLIITGLVLGAIYYTLLSKKLYKSTMVFSCDHLNTRILESTIDKFNLLCLEKERTELMNVLGIDSLTAHNVHRFEFEPFIQNEDIIEMEVLREQLSLMAIDEKKDLVEKVIKRLIVEHTGAYKLSVSVYDPQIVSKLQPAIINYFKTSEYLKKRIEINRQNNLARKAKLMEESKKLDSLKTVLVQNYQNVGKTSRGSGNVFLGDEKLANPLEVFNADLSINQQILDIDRALYVDYWGVEVIDPFSTIKEPDNFSLPVILFMSFWLSIVTGYVIIGLWKFDRLLARYETSA